MRISSGYLPIESDASLMGLMTSHPSTDISPSANPRLMNMLIKDGVCYKRSGYNELVAQDLDGTVMALVDFELLDGTKKLVALTSTRQYRFNDGSDTWVDITTQGSTYAITSVSTPSDWFKIAGDHTSEFSAGKNFVVTGSTGNNGEYTVISSSFGGGFTQINVAIVANAVADGNINSITELTTVDGDFIDWVVGTDDTTHRLYMTNGRDTPRYWDGATSTFTIWAPTYTDFVTCKTFEVFGGHLVLGNVTISGGGDTGVKLVSWSDTNEFDEFEDGTAGDTLIPEMIGPIIYMETLGDRLMVYSNNSIAGGMAIGFPIIFSFTMIVPDGTRLVSPRGIVSLLSAHLFASQENIYFFDGTAGIRPVGDNIRALYKQSLSHQYGTRLFTFNDIAKRVIYLFVPTGNTTHVVYTLDYNIFNLNEFIWTRSSYNDLPSCFGFFSRRDVPSWVDPPDVSWEDDYGIWEEEGEQVNFPVRIMGSGSEVHLMDEGTGLDDGVEVTAEFETKDFTVPVAKQSLLGRWAEIEADLAGDEVSVYYSTDQGATWTLVDTEDLISRFKRYTFTNIDVSSETLRLKFSSTAYFALRWFRVWVKPGSPRQ